VESPRLRYSWPAYEEGLRSLPQEGLESEDHDSGQCGRNQYSLQPALSALYGDAAIREIYGATEGMLGQQMDEQRAWVPNYDLFFFEVQVGSGIKMLHEMRPGETGSLIVSTPILPRYRIGDLIRAYRPPYFRCIGREMWWTRLYHFWNEFSSLNFDRL